MGVAPAAENAVNTIGIATNRLCLPLDGCLSLPLDEEVKASALLSFCLCLFLRYDVLLECNLVSKYSNPLLILFTTLSFIELSQVLWVDLVLGFESFSE